MTAEQYLVWEREQPERHEYYRGDVFAMAGGTPRHNALDAAVTIELGGAPKGTPCRILSADQRIIAGEQDHYVYADVSVVCGELELHPGTVDVLSNPHIVVEVLLKSTEAYDRGLKWEAYRRIPSVQDYLLVPGHMDVCRAPRMALRPLLRGRRYRRYRRKLGRASPAAAARRRDVYSRR